MAMWKTVDPILMEVINNNLLSIAEQAGITLIKCAFSVNIKERRDCSTVLLDKKGRVIAQAAHIPIHLGSMLNVGVEILKKYGIKNIHRGEVFINNDPFLGGSSHLSDFTIITPMFYKNRVTFFAVNTAHHVDVGGRVPGSMSPDCKSIYEEGIRIPLIKIVEKGKLNEEILELIAWNCRDPEERKADIRGQIAANYITEKPLTDLCEKYGTNLIDAVINKILDYTEGKIRAKIEELPDGEYEFINYLDDDGVKDEKVPIKVTVKIKGNKVRVDFTGSGEQATGSLNTVRSALLAGVYFAFKAALDPLVLPNEGFYRAIDIYAPYGTILNPKPNAAVGTRTDTVQKVVDVVLGALFKALPRERIIAGSNATAGSFMLYGHDYRRNKEFCYGETIGGGSGARCNKDGLDGVHVYATNTSNLPVESLESEYPLIVEQYSLIQDSGGAGKFRGGMGIRRDIRTICDNVFLNSKAEGTKTSPWGVYGGEEGLPATVVLNPDTPYEIIVHGKRSDIRLKAGDVVSIRTPGAGGFGHPSERDQESITKDIREGVISISKAKESYLFKENEMKEKNKGV